MPISLDLFKDPVTLSTGQTYDRFYIEKWLSAGNLTCPVTMQKLNDASMVPNHTLSHLIHHWRQSNNQIHQECIEIAQIDQFPFVSMKKVIQSEESSLEDKLKVLEKVEDLFQEQVNKDSCLIKLDFFKTLVELVLTTAARNTLNLHGDVVLLLEKALFCGLKLMPFSDMTSLNLLEKESHFEGLVSLLQKGSFLIKKSLCLVIEAISLNIETQQLAEKMGNSVIIVTEIVHLVEQNESSEAGITALSGLSLIKQNQESLVRHGALQALISHLEKLEKQEKNVVRRTMCTIESLLSLDLGKESVINHPSGVSSLVKMVFRVSNHEGSESAVNSLFILCLGSKIAREKAIDNGVLTQLLLLLQSQCHGRTKTKARRLLKCLRSMWKEDSKSNNGL